MRALRKFISSLGTRSRRNITDLLSEGFSNPTYSQIDNIPSYAPIDPETIADYKTITSFDMNMPIMKVTKVNTAAWNQMADLEQDISDLGKIVRAANETLSKSADSVKSTIELLSEMEAKRNTFDTVYTERFDNTAGTDTRNTDAVILNGYLTPGYTSIPIVNLNLRILDSSYELIGQTQYDDRLSFSCGGAGPNDLFIDTEDYSELTGCVATMEIKLLSAAAVNSLSLECAEGDILTIYGVKADGEVIEIATEVNSASYETTFPNVALASFLVTVHMTAQEQGYTIQPMPDPIYRILPMPDEYGELYRVDLETGDEFGFDKVDANALYALYERLDGRLFNRTITKRETTVNITPVSTFRTDPAGGTWTPTHGTGNWGERFDWPQFNPVEEHMPDIPVFPDPPDAVNLDTYDNSITVAVGRAIVYPAATWVSSILNIDGEVKDMSISAEQNTPSGCAIMWSASVAGSDWIPVHPRNIPQVENEPLFFDSYGKAYLRFNGEPGEVVIESMDGLVEEGMDWILDPNTGNIIGLIYPGVLDSIMTATYTPADSGSIDPSSYGLSAASGQIIEAMSGSIPGERIATAGTDTVYLEHDPYVVMDPEPNIRAFADGIEATVLTDEQSLSDPAYGGSTLVCKISGKVVTFNKEVFDVTVYYKYVQMDVRIRADLMTAKIESGDIPAVDSVTYEVKNS